ncbi:EF-hand domain-containing protein [Rhizobium sp. S152]|uniref:EF-hand domain-containing protein n=1 Tax=Rhizobium sp. S152 TaxID=3055038 RepID=UPI0025A9B8F4|nr:EF-hand domain-containing protein [Rhizobium sp. S152]MDM9624954.1 EF-hand domain-containing protein [Rhizobium sp. S152]
MTMKTAAIAMASLLFTGLAQAQTTVPPEDPKASQDAIKREIDATFTKIDANSDGSISREEFGAFTEKTIAQQVKIFNQTFDTLDIDKDGKISKAEAAENKAFAAGFDEVDADKDGFVSKQELALAMKAAQEDEGQD